MSYTEEHKKLLNVDFFNHILKCISSNRIIDEDVCEKICAEMMVFVTQVLIKAKDNTVACGQYKVTEDFVRCALRDAGFPLTSADEISHRVSKMKNADNVIEFGNRPKFIPSNDLSGTKIHYHWLAIDGEQPPIVENPINFAAMNYPESPKRVYKAPRPSSFLKMVDSIEDFDDVLCNVNTTHPVCMEQQVFFQKTMEAVMGSDNQERIAALEIIRTDPSFTALLTRFSTAIKDGVRINLFQQNVAFLIYIMRLTEALLLNQSLCVEAILHDLLPSIISVQVMDWSNDAIWTLREYCGKLLLLIINRWKQPELKQRILTFLSNSLYRENPYIPMIYGIVYAMELFGLESVEHSLLPHLKVISKRIGTYLTDNEENTKDPERDAAKRVHDLVCRCIQTFKNVNPERSQTPKFLDLFKYFGCA